jgi:NAD(P)-dependent dehydrogenase (short-subunit alcohol dehydrogenase family)
MEGDHVIVFGGSSGIGEATAKQLTTAGARVTIVARDVDRLAAARGRIGGGVASASVDATDRTAVAEFFERIAPFEHLVLCHSGGKGGGAFRSLDLDGLRSGVEGKLLAQLTVAQASLGKLKPTGSMTFVSAASARVAISGTSGLAAINGAIEATVPTLAKELAPLRVNAVSPGVIDTPWWNRMPSEARDAVFRQMAAELPVRRVGQPEDVARAIVFLIESTFVTGVVIGVDGGAHLGP